MIYIATLCECIFFTKFDVCSFICLSIFWYGWVAWNAIIIYSTVDPAKGHASSRLYHYLFAMFDSIRMVDHDFSTISHKGRRAATFISIYIVYLIPCEWWIMRFSTISHKGRRVATFISIYVVYLIPCEWQIMRFSTILYKGRRAATFITICLAYLI